MSNSPVRTIWNEIPKPIQIVVYTVLGIIAAFGFGLLFGWIIVWLWNWLMPMIFGLPTITFWQGVGVFILAKILFGGFSSHSDSSKSSKKKEKGDWSFEWDGDTGKGKFGRWEHYDEWWKAEGKDSFERYAKANGDSQTEDADDTQDPMDE
ncbi:MAG TPA: hypothetical protein PKU80_02675 [Candidatus Limiplasma sp.]|nr:hypothetical protein [Candidatus Limiplasma sp.]HRX08152.1 hypothetical protein [Candidatus Limiplasma sp.]